MVVQKINKAAVEDFVFAIGQLLRRVRADAPSELKEFSWTQKAVLSRLEKDGPATAADLARAEGVKPQSMGMALAQMENMGLVERSPHPADRRQINIQLTAEGVALRKNKREAMHAWLSQVMAKLDDDERATIFKASEIIKRMVKA